MALKIRVEKRGRIYRVSINDPKPVVVFPFEGEEVSPDNLFLMRFSEDAGGIEVSIPLSVDTHILGLGEKAFEIDRRRIKVVMWNTDAYGYTWFSDPLYVSIPFFIRIDRDILGYFFNTPSRLVFDIGVSRYDMILVRIPESEAEIFVFQGDSVEEILEHYTMLTGRPFMPPEWALGYQISRYSYYPQDVVVEVVERHIKSGIPVSAVYLDIDYMSKYRIFTWDEERFPSPKDMIKKLHSLGVKVITIVDPCIRLDQEYPLFAEGLGKYIENPDGTIYVGTLWPGLCAYPDFLNSRTRDWWASLVRRWVREYGVDGIWLDMNEPSQLGKKEIDPRAIHRLDDGRKAHHERVHNAYALYEAIATKGEVDFVLSRAGYSGIQRYSAIWTGDNTTSWEDLTLQIALVLGLSISGVPFVGCDIGGFAGRIKNDYQLLYRYYQVSLFFPLFRNHKGKEGSDQEIYQLPSYWKEKIRSAIMLRYKFLPYLHSLAREAHEKGHPIVRPLAYHYYKDEDAYRINDEYMVGDRILYAPQINKEGRRLIYLPEGTWLGWWDNKEYRGMQWIESDEEFPIFIRRDSIVPTSHCGKIVFHIYGDKGSITLGDGTSIEYIDGELRLSRNMDYDIVKRPHELEKPCPETLE